MDSSISLANCQSFIDTFIEKTLANKKRKLGLPVSWLLYQKYWYLLCGIIVKSFYINNNSYDILFNYFSSFTFYDNKKVQNISFINKYIFDQTVNVYINLQIYRNIFEAIQRHVYWYIEYFKIRYLPLLIWKGQTHNFSLVRIFAFKHNSGLIREVVGLQYGTYKHKPAC